MAFDFGDFSKSIVELIAKHEEAGTDPVDEFGELYRSSSIEILDAEIRDLDIQLMERRGISAGFRSNLRSRWGQALDLYELLLNHCWEVGQGTNDHYRPVAIRQSDHRFEALARLHGKATLTGSEILSLLETGHASGAMGRWRTLHEVDVISAFLSQQSDEIAYRFLRYEEVQTLKARRAYDQFHERLGHEATTTGTDGDPEILQASLVEEFGNDFLQRNGWAIPVFGRTPKDSEIEEAVQLDHYRPYYYLASDAVHATPKGLMGTMQILGDRQVIAAGPSNAGLADPGHGAALSLTRATITLVNYCAFELDAEGELSEQVSVLLTINLLLGLSDRIGDAFLVAHERLGQDEEQVRRNSATDH